VAEVVVREARVDWCHDAGDSTERLLDAHVQAALVLRDDL
jgi:hypothetical protein